MNWHKVVGSLTISLKFSPDTDCMHTKAGVDKSCENSENSCGTI